MMEPSGEANESNDPKPAAGATTAGAPPASLLIPLAIRLPANLEPPKPKNAKMPPMTSASGFRLKKEPKKPLFLR